MWKDEALAAPDWTILQLALDQLSTKGDSSLMLGITAGHVLREKLFKERDGAGLEAMTDEILHWLQKPKRLKADRVSKVVVLIHYCLSNALEVAPDERKLIAGAKLSAVEGLHHLLEVEIEKANESFKLAASLCISHLMGSPPEGLSRAEFARLKIEGVHKVIELIGKTRPYCIHLASALCQWAREAVSDFEMRPYMLSEPELETTVLSLNVDCLIDRARFEERLGLRAALLASLETATFAAALDAGRLGEATRLAREAMRVGDALLGDSAGGDGAVPERDPDNLPERLYMLSRFSGDPEEVATRLDAIRDVVREVANRHMEERRWVEAADAFSNLGYRYFTTAELFRLKRLYLLSIYFFEKAEYCRAKDPSQGYGRLDRTNPNAPEPGYRKFEAEGFIYGASANLATGRKAVELFNDAAYAHSKAAQMVFGNMGLHMFYNSAAHFFYALGHLTSVLLSTSLNEITWRFGKAAAALHECFPVLKNVFGYYEETLSHFAGERDKPIPDNIAAELARTNHPAPDKFVRAAEEVRQAVRDADVASVRVRLPSLLAFFNFVNPMG